MKFFFFHFLKLRLFFQAFFFLTMIVLNILGFESTRFLVICIIKKLSHILIF